MPEWRGSIAAQGHSLTPPIFSENQFGEYFRGYKSNHNVYFRNAAQRLVVRGSISAIVMHYRKTFISSFYISSLRSMLFSM